MSSLHSALSVRPRISNDRKSRSLRPSRWRRIAIVLGVGSLVPVLEHRSIQSETVESSAAVLETESSDQASCELLLAGVGEYLACLLTGGSNCEDLIDDERIDAPQIRSILLANTATAEEAGMTTARVETE